MFILLDRTFLISFFFIVLAMMTSGQNELDLVFRTMNDEYISFEGEDIPIECSYSISMQNTMISIYYDSGESIASSSNRLVVVTLSSVSNSPTLYCNVSGDMQGGAKFTITTIPRDESPYCVSNYDGGVIVNAAVKLSCYVDTQDSMNLIEQWRDNNNMVLQMDGKENIFRNTRRTSRTVMVDSSNNGTYYTCVEVKDGSVSATCQVGPIFVYDNVFTYIEFPEKRNISHGDTGEFRCSSIPSSNITWTVPQTVNYTGIMVNINGPVITITVPNNVSFVGSLKATCEAKWNDEQGSTLLDVYIADTIKAQSGAETVGTTTLKGTTTSVLTPQSDSLIIYIICGAVGGVLIILIVVLLIICLCKNIIRKGYKSNATQPVKHQIQENGEPEYADPPLGMTALDDPNGIGGYPHDTSDDNSHNEEGGLYTAVNKESKEQFAKGNSYALVPPSNNLHAQSNSYEHRNEIGESNLASNNDLSDSSEDNTIYAVEPPPYATVDRQRHVVIDEGLLDDNGLIEGDYSEYQ